MQTRVSSNWLLFYELVKQILDSIVRAITNFIHKLPHQCEKLHTQKKKFKSRIIYVFIPIYITQLTMLPGVKCPSI